MADHIDRAEDFEAYVGRPIRVRSGRHVLTLGEVAMGPSSGAAGLRQPFILVFTGPPGDVLPEGLHTLELQAGKCVTLYLMPIHTPSPDRQDYQAVFD